MLFLDFLNNDVLNYPIYLRTKKFKVGYVPQYGGYFSDLTLYQNLKAIAEILIKDPREQNSKIEYLISKFELDYIRNIKASFLSGLVKVRTELKGINQEPTRPIHLLYSIQNDYVKPDFIIDISDYYEKKLESIHCFKSQFYDPNSKEKESFISSKGFLNFIESRSVELGHSIGVKYGEGFTIESNLNIKSLKNII